MAALAPAADPASQPVMRVRRLTAVEAARLQGFPDHYLSISRRKTGKLAADGSKYMALGNSWAVPCVRWIGRRIELSTQSHSLWVDP